MDAFGTFGTWLHGTSLSWAMDGGYPLLWPLCETLHFIGLSLLVGITAILDLRMMGVAKGIPIRALQRLMPWASGGFAVNAITGFLFFAGDPPQYLDNFAFWMKMLFIALAGANVGVFYVSGTARRIEAAGAGDEAPPLARLIGAASLILWVGVMYWGRMLPFIGNAF
jgi:hypothetical protein